MGQALHITGDMRSKVSAEEWQVRVDLGDGVPHTVRISMND